MTETLLSEFDRCAPWLEAALAVSSGGYFLSDVRAMIAAGEAHLWPLKNSVFVTIIGQYPRRRVCRIWLAGGNLSDLQEPQVEAALIAYAEAAGCHSLELIGRPGWTKAFHGFVRHATVLVRELN